MRPTRDQPELNDDGTPRRKYELDDDDGNRMVLRGTIAIAFANAIVLAKNVLFGEPARAPYPQSSPERASPERIATEPESGFELVPPTDTDNATDPLLPAEPATGFARLLYTTSGPITQSGQPAAPPPHPLSGLIAAGNDNIALYGARPGAAISSFAAELASSALFVRGDGGGSQGGDGPPRQSDVDVGDDEGGDDDDDADPDPDAVNRSPVVSGPILLGSLMTNQAIVIALSDLLRNASDADGDLLHVDGLASTTGKLEVRSDGNWLFVPDRGDETNVTFTFAVTDGSLAVDQTALLDLVALPQVISEGTEGSDTIVGTPLRDVIDARGGHDIVIGLDGDDVIHGGSGNDRIVAGDGDDVVDAGDGDDIVFAGGGNDVVSGGTGHDILFGEAGDDILRGQDGDDTIAGGDGRDRISGGTGNDTISGNEGSDLIEGDEGDDVIDGGNGDDFVIGGEGSDHAAGGTGNDVFIATSRDGNDQYSGGAGLDTYNIAGTSQAAIIDLANGTASSADIGNDQIAEIEIVVSGGGDDIITGDDEANEIAAGAGDDTVAGSGGDDVFIARIDDGDDIYTGGTGRDTYDLSATTTDAFIDLASGTATSDDIGDDRIAEIEIVVSGGGDDVITGDDEANEIAAGAGDDTVAGSGGDDVFIARIDDGDDIYTGGTGRDTYDLSATTTDAFIDLASGTATSADIGDDRIAEIEIVVSGGGDDIITGDDEANEITAGAGADTVAGSGGDDVFIARIDDGDDIYTGGTGRDTYDLSATSADAIIDLASGTATSTDIGNDRIAEIESVICGDGDDIVIANDEANMFVGGAGNDTFVFGSVAAIGSGSGRDKILDFEIGDRIDLDNISEEFAELIDATFEDHGIRRFVLIGEQEAFTTPGQMRFKYETFDGSPVTILQGNINYDSDTEFELEFSGRIELREDDFVHR